MGQILSTTTLYTILSTLVCDDIGAMSRVTDRVVAARHLGTTYSLTYYLNFFGPY